MITTAVMSKRKRSEHYVNNKEFLAALIKYREDVEITFIRLNGREPTKEDRSKRWETKPQIPRYVGECFLKIANHLSFKPNFVNYMFKEDMISDGIENCVQYIHNFNPERSQNLLHTLLKSFTSHFFVAFKEKTSVRNQKQNS
jgi:hypothetical protein